ncbi:hypothetical protein CNYM01_13946 [Colletotrichum nymphaeae SA-01]|uniref:Uncharacterized protein n=1 Tax=Colletotrichum nymphaeae SA-01 TaxID=1460502 RepID=A0A135RQZ6_9PEZI|nr:hypothetical protein CNYM01_13946 [Colletotrichum nymphaeae SA-01]
MEVKKPQSAGTALGTTDGFLLPPYELHNILRRQKTGTTVPDKLLTLRGPYRMQAHESIRQSARKDTQSKPGINAAAINSNPGPSVNTLSLNHLSAVLEARPHTSAKRIYPMKMAATL